MNFSLGVNVNVHTLHEEAWFSNNIIRWEFICKTTQRVLQKFSYFAGINRTQVSEHFTAFIVYHYTWLNPTKHRQRFNIDFSILARKSGFYPF